MLIPYSLGGLTEREELRQVMQRALPQQMVRPPRLFG